MAAHGAPERVLVLGGGDGMAVREVLKYPSAEQLTLVELDPQMTRFFASRPLLAALNDGAPASPKLRRSKGCRPCCSFRPTWRVLMSSLPGCRTRGWCTLSKKQVADKRHLCRSPQERLFIDSAWAESLLPTADRGSATHNAHQRFAAAVTNAQKIGFAVPTQRGQLTAAHAAHGALDAITLDTWLALEGLVDARLRWCLDCCCRDDHSAGSARVSAWAELRYFASRHGFHVPGDEAGKRGPAFTWPHGNAWLVERPAAHRPRGAAGGRKPAQHADAGLGRSRSTGRDLDGEQHGADRVPRAGHTRSHPTAGRRLAAMSAACAGKPAATHLDLRGRRVHAGARRARQPGAGGAAHIVRPAAIGR